VGKRGPKTKFTKKLGETFVRLAKDGKTLDQIAEVVGVSSRTLTNWMGSNEDLLLAVREARQIADELVEASLFAKAVGYSHPEEKVFCSEGMITTHETQKHYPPDTQAAMFWLRNRQPERWKEKNESDVKVETNNYGSLTDEQLAAKIAEMLAKGSVKP
jgi:AcrR family transcriptional regulator